jgi:hypothetical protein
MSQRDRPSDGAILERAFSLVNEAMFTVALQVRRLDSTEPEDKEFALRWWVDLQFLIVALRRMERAASLAAKVSAVAEDVGQALRIFRRAIPGLRVMRNVGEHIDAYGVDDPKRHHPEIKRRMLQVGRWDGRTFTWLADASGREVNLDVIDARTAAEQLFEAVRVAQKRPR